MFYGISDNGIYNFFFFFSSRRRHTRSYGDWSSDVCSSDLKQYRYKFRDEKLSKRLQEQFKAETLGSDRLRTLLLLIMRNASTDSPWPVSNNPRAKYNNRCHKDCNLDLPLWQLIRASAAAPTYFPPETVRLGEKEFIFIDGGITMYNNPAFQAFLMATVEPFNLNWPAGEAQL